MCPTSADRKQSANEVAAATLADQGGVFNSQQQLRVGWPAEPVVVRAYLDQLERDEALSESLAADLTEALERSAAQLEDGGHDADLAAGLDSLAAALDEEGLGQRQGDTVRQRRRAALGETLSGIAARLRTPRSSARETSQRSSVRSRMGVYRITPWAKGY